MKRATPGAYEEFGKFIERYFVNDPVYLGLRERYPDASGEKIVRLLLHRKDRWRRPVKLSREERVFLTEVYQESLKHLNFFWKGYAFSEENKNRRLALLKLRIDNNALTGEALGQKQG